MISLGRDQVIGLACVLREAERSIHRALNAPWEALQAYYDATKTAEVRRSAEQLAALVSAEPANGPRPSGQEIGMQIRSPGLCKRLLGQWLGRWKRGWSFREQEVAFTRATLDALQSLLRKPRRPPADVLVRLRIDLCTCGGIVALRCWGLRELDRLVFLKHFDQTEWLPALTADAIMNGADAARPDHPAVVHRHSA